MRAYFCVLALLGSLSSGQALAQPITIRTFGYGSTTAEAIADGQRQALTDARQALAFRPADEKSAPDTGSRQLGQVQLIRTKRLAAGRYEAELVAEVSGGAAAAVRQRVALLLDPRTEDSLLGLRMLDEARQRLATDETLVIYNASGPGVRLLFDQLQEAQNRLAPGADPGFDVLLVLAPETSPSMDGGRSHYRVRLTTIDVATERISAVTTMRLSVGRTDDMLVHEAGRRIAGLAWEGVGHVTITGHPVRVVTASIGAADLQVGDHVLVLRAGDLGKSFSPTAMTEGEIISLNGTSARVWIRRPLPKAGRYVARQLNHKASNGIISDTDW